MYNEWLLWGPRGFWHTYFLLRCYIDYVCMFCVTCACSCYTCLCYIHMGYMHVILHYALLHITDTVHTKHKMLLLLLQHVPVLWLLCTVYTVHVRNVLVMTVTVCACVPSHHNPQETTVWLGNWWVCDAKEESWQVGRHKRTWISTVCVGGHRRTVYYCCVWGL